MVRSSHELIFESNFSDDRSSDVNIVESLDYPIEKQVSDPDEFDFSYEFLNSCDIEFVHVDSISILDFFFSSEFDLIDYKSSDLVTIDSSLVESALNTHYVEYRKFTCVSAKATCIGSFLLNVILMLLFLGERICSWMHNYLLALSC